MGAVPGVGVVGEVRSTSYQSGQIFNRPLARKGKWILFRLLYLDLARPGVSQWPYPIEWSNGAVSNPPPPWADAPNAGNCFGLLKCDVYAGAPLISIPNRYRAYPNFAPEFAGGQLLAPSWRSTPAKYDGGVTPNQFGLSVVTIGINTEGIDASTLYFDFQSEIIKRQSYAVGNPKPVAVQQYTAESFPFETAVDWAISPFDPDVDSKTICKTDLSAQATWYNSGVQTPVVNTFSLGSTLFSIDLINDRRSQPVPEKIDLAPPLLPEKNAAGSTWFPAEVTEGYYQYWRTDQVTGQLVPITS